MIGNPFCSCSVLISFNAAIDPSDRSLPMKTSPYIPSPNARSLMYAVWTSRRTVGALMVMTESRLVFFRKGLRMFERAEAEVALDEATVRLVGTTLLLFLEPLPFFGGGGGGGAPARRTGDLPLFLGGGGGGGVRFGGGGGGGGVRRAVFAEANAVDDGVPVPPFLGGGGGGGGRGRPAAAAFTPFFSGGGGGGGRDRGGEPRGGDGPWL